MSVFIKYEDIEAWKLGRRLVREIYRVTRVGEFARDWGLKDQIQRAAVSVCSNIAEGYARRGNKELASFLWIAKGSAAEVQSQSFHAVDLGYLSEDNQKEIYKLTEEVQIKIYRLIQVLNNAMERRKGARGVEGARGAR